MPQFELGSQYRLIPAWADGWDIAWSNRPLLCRLSIHRPFRALSRLAGAMGCTRCPYYWGREIETGEKF